MCSKWDALVKHLDSWVNIANIWVLKNKSKKGIFLHFQIPNVFQIQETWLNIVQLAICFSSLFNPWVLDLPNYWPPYTYYLIFSNQDLLWIDNLRLSSQYQRLPALLLCPRCLIQLILKILRTCCFLISIIRLGFWLPIILPQWLLPWFTLSHYKIYLELQIIFKRIIIK